MPYLGKRLLCLIWRWIECGIARRFSISLVLDGVWLLLRRPQGLKSLHVVELLLLVPGSCYVVRGRQNFSSVLPPDTSVSTHCRRCLQSAVVVLVSGEPVVPVVDGVGMAAIAPLVIVFLKTLLLQVLSVEEL